MKLSKDFSAELRNLRESLGAQFAIISSINGHDYEVLAVESDLDIISVGDKFEVKNTYCNEVVNSKKMVTYDHVGAIEEMLLHPIYTTVQLEAYIGEPLVKEGNVIGTLNFSSFLRKDPVFSEEEILKVKNLAREIETALD